MKINTFYQLIISLIFSFSMIINAQTLLIQENDTGFCAVDGTIETSVTGYTGIGYADSDRGIGKSVSWSVQAQSAGTCWVKWRYANGGGTGDRKADLLLNLDTAIIDVNFKHTGEWTNWTISDSFGLALTEGYNDIRLMSKSVDGLANFDYATFSGPGIEVVECIPVYTMDLSKNIADAGTISVEPELVYYHSGAEVTIHAHANPGYFFQSWSGNVSSTDTTYAFILNGNVKTMAMFYPVGTTMDTNIIGYASVQDDQGTPFLVIGGSLGDTVVANTLSDLQTYLQSSEPLVVTVSKKIEGIGEVKIKSNKTLLGITDSAYIRGIMIQIDGAQNVIIQNMKFSHVIRYDEVEITNASRNIWIDHCDFFTDRDHDIDYYDGLLDIKNASSFITISWCRLHDHKKSSLISSGDDSFGDTAIRVTYHHNFFYNNDARLPSIRFGKAHIFNNYYLNNENAISTRMGACVRVENNYFENVVKAVFNDQSIEIGNVHLLENHYGGAFCVTEPACVLDVPYSYESFLDATEDVPEIVGDTGGTQVSFQEFRLSDGLEVFPNPASNLITIIYSFDADSAVNIYMHDSSGRIVKSFFAGNHIGDIKKQQISVEDLEPGLYYLELSADSYRVHQKVIIYR